MSDYLKNVLVCTYILVSKDYAPKCHINSQLQRKILFFFFNYKYWKTMYRKKGHGDEIVH